MTVTKHADTRMFTRGIPASTALACVRAGEKSPGWLGATRHYLMGYTAVTVPHGKKGMKIVTAYKGRPQSIGIEVGPCRIIRDPPGSV